MTCYCEIGYGETPDFSFEEDVRAKKQHRCVECLEPILPGETYNRYTGKWDGEVKTYTTCTSCKELRDQWEAEPWSEGFTFGSVGCWYAGKLEQIAQQMDEEQAKLGLSQS